MSTIASTFSHAQETKDVLHATLGPSEVRCDFIIAEADRDQVENRSFHRIVASTRDGSRWRRAVCAPFNSAGQPDHVSTLPTAIRRR